MRAHQARFITACQQLLALAVVLAALTPAASIVSLDVVGSHPAAPPTSPEAAQGMSLSAYVRQANLPSQVDAAPVEPEVRKVALTAPADRPYARVAARTVRGPAKGSMRVVSNAQTVTGYGAVGVTWARGVRLADDQIVVQARTKQNGAWSRWTTIQYDADHGPDPGSAEARRAVPGTDVLLVGRVADVQVRATTASGVAVPAGLTMSVIDPGRDVRTVSARPALDPQRNVKGPQIVNSSQRAAFTPMPSIYSRAQWGADERMRSASSLRYYEVHAGFVHHTVTGNNYSEADVPSIIRSIYAFHTKSRGWSDIGYNFLVDKFGRVWEGRYGGIDRPVVGAHTLGYNEYSFAMSALGNYETVAPPEAMLQAYGALFAWKLSLHGVAASSTVQQVGQKAFQAINGHRDAGKTACPGKYLYAQIPLIRQYAAAAQVGWSGRELESNLMGSPNPDLIVRRASDKQGFIIQTTGSTTPVAAPVPTGIDLSGAAQLLNVGDWDRDGYGDFVARQKADKALWLYRGDGTGKFAPPVVIGSGAGLKLITAVGDVTGDGYPDLMAQPKGAAIRIYVGAGMGGFSTNYVAYSKLPAKRFLGIGRMDADGAPDGLFVTKGARKMLMQVNGNGPGGLTGSSRKVKGAMGRFDWVIGVSDLDVTGHADVIVRRKKSGKLFAMSGSESGFGKPVLIGNAAGFDLAG